MKQALRGFSGSFLEQYQKAEIGEGGSCAKKAEK